MVQIRKIETAEEIERKRKRNNLILSIIMILILVFSTAGYFSLREDTSTSSGGSDNVQNVGDAWIITYGDQTIRVSSSPESAQNTSILSLKTIDYYSGKTVYVASDSDAGFYEIASTVGRYTGRMQQACYGECEKNLPEKNCDDTMIVIRTNLTEKGRIYEEDNCVFIEGGLDAVDAFIYQLFGVR